MQKTQPFSNPAANDSPQVNPLSGGTTDEIVNLGPSAKRSDLSLQVSPRPKGFGKSPSGKGLLQSHDASNSIPSPSKFFQALSFKKKAMMTDYEKISLNNTTLENPLLENSVFPWKKCASVPVTPASNASPSSSTSSTPRWARAFGERSAKSRGLLAKPPVSRSLSVPGRNVVIVRSLSFAADKEVTQADTSDDQIVPVPGEEEDEEIPEEEAVCRICFDTCDKENMLKMECSCKGDLRLIHEECAIKWFTAKGNKACDVCGREVLNLPVTLIRVPSSKQRNHVQGNSQQNLDSEAISAWQDFVVLVLISSICYFFFLEQLLIHDMKTQAIIVAAPFAFTLGLLASIFAVLLAIREYIWMYAALEFALVAVALYLSYTFLQWQVVYSIMVSSVIGFGISMVLNSLYIQYFASRVQVSGSSIPV